MARLGLAMVIFTGAWILISPAGMLGTAVIAMMAAVIAVEVD